MHENKYNNYRIPAGLLITFLEKALLLIHMETHLNDVSVNYNSFLNIGDSHTYSFKRWRF